MKEINGILKVLAMVIDGLVNFLSFIPKAMSYLTEVLMYMPVEITSFMLCVITGSIVLMVIGRHK